MTEPQSMRVFVRVVELGSFTRAAESLGIAKGAASVAVQRLEAAVGTRLLHRTTRRISLTQDGQICYARCLDLLGELDELEAMFRSEPQALRGRLRVGLSSGVATSFVIPRLPELLDAHPELAIELSATDRRVDVVREGFDCVVRVGDVVDESLVARRLGAMPLVSCASPAYLERYGVPRTLDDMKGHRLVHYVSTLGAKPYGWEWLDRGEVRTIEMAGAVTVNSSEAFRAACHAGLGIIQVPLVAVRHDLEVGRLVEVLPDYAAEALPVAILYAARRHLPRRAQVFMDWLGRTLAPYLEPSSGDRS